MTSALSGGLDLGALIGKPQVGHQFKYLFCVHCGATTRGNRDGWTVHDGEAVCRVCGIEKLWRECNPNAKVFAAVGLFWDNGAVLAIQRPGQPETDLGLIGGKVEDGEDPKVTLTREVFEEVGITVEKAEPMFDRFVAPNEAVRCFRVTQWSGEARSMEGTWVGWVPPAQMVTPACTFRRYNRAVLQAFGIL